MLEYIILQQLLYSLLIFIIIHSLIPPICVVILGHYHHIMNPHDDVTFHTHHLTFRSPLNRMKNDHDWIDCFPLNRADCLGNQRNKCEFIMSKKKQSLNTKDLTAICTGVW